MKIIVRQHPFCAEHPEDVMFWNRDEGNMAVYSCLGCKATVEIPIRELEREIIFRQLLYEGKRLGVEMKKSLGLS